MSDQSDTYKDLDPTVKGRVDGLFVAVEELNLKAEYHNERLSDASNTDHHRAARNTCANMASKLQREVVNTVLDPKASKYYYDDKERADD